jgi:hypothetical protein
MLSINLWTKIVYISKKTLVSNLWIVGEFVGNKYTDGFTDIQSALKKFTRFILSVYLLANITYHRYNIICNFIGVLILIVIHVVIIFKLSEIYRRSSSVDNPPSIIAVFIDLSCCFFIHHGLL